VSAATRLGRDPCVPAPARPRPVGCDGDRGDVVLADERPCDAGPRRGAPVRRSTPSDTIAWASASDRLGLADPSRDRAMSIGAEARSLPASRAVRTIAWAPEPRPACPRSRTLPRIWGITHHVHTPSAGGRSRWSRESDGPSRAGSGVAERQASVLATSTEPSVRWSPRAAVAIRCQSEERPGPQGVNIMCDSARTERWRLDASSGWWEPGPGRPAAPGRAPSRGSAGLHVMYTPRRPAGVRRGPAGRMALPGVLQGRRAGGVRARGAHQAFSPVVAQGAVVIRRAAGPPRVNIMCDSAPTDRWWPAASSGWWEPGPGARRVGRPCSHPADTRCDSPG
jgi:hypothetical protein